jgi:hypothetical protein
LISIIDSREKKSQPKRPLECGSLLPLLNALLSLHYERRKLACAPLKIIHNFYTVIGE